MNEIIPNLYITGRLVARNLPEDEYRVLLLSLMPLNREHVRVAIDDAVPWPCETVRFAADTISGWLAKGERVCVACDAGISRSAGAITAYLVSKEGMGIDEAMELIKSRHPIANPHPLIVESIIKCSSQKKN
ncbi:MAG: dual specificity protein phosphatase family protein [Candidatus Brocadiales bacterium]